MPEWVPGLLYATGQRVWYKLNVYQVAVSGGGVAGTTAHLYTLLVMILMVVLHGHL